MLDAIGSSAKNGQGAVRFWQHTGARRQLYSGPEGWGYTALLSNMTFSAPV
jgi:hypothetical protein